MPLVLLPELRAYLAKKKWAFKQVTDEDIAVKICPFCGKSKWKFYIHSRKTIYRCWHCDARGNLFKLKRELGDFRGAHVVSAAKASGETKNIKNKIIDIAVIEKWHSRLLRSRTGMQYLKEVRGFTDDSIRHFKLGLQKNGNCWWIAIPHLIRGICYNVKFRSLPPAEKTFRRVKDGASILFNSDALEEYEDIVLAEAETDAIALWQAGVKNIISLTCGADTFLPEWYDQLADKSSITLVLDADAVGQQGARAIARRLGLDRCKNVLLPYHDANDMLINVGGDELKRSISKAEQFEVSGVISIADAIVRCKETAESTEAGILTPWTEVNSLLGNGWHPGDLIILSARVKTGKTSWALNILDYQSRLGVPAIMFCLEMSVERLAQKLVSSVRRKSVEQLLATDYELARYRLRGQPLFFIEPDWSGSFKLENIIDKIKESVKRYGAKILVFDHLHFLCRSLQYITTEIGQVTRAFKLLAQELDIVNVLVAQPRKIEGNRIIKYDDIKDSSSIPADSDQIILLHRSPRAVGLNKDEVLASDHEVLEPKTLVRVDAARFRGGGECFLYFDGACSLFKDWEDEQA